LGRRSLLIAGILLLVGGAAVAAAGLARSGESTTTTIAGESTTTTIVTDALPGADEIRTGDMAGARRKIEAHLRTNPDDVRARYLLALTYERTGDFDKALEVYRGVLEVDPADFEAYFRIGVIQRRQGDLEAAAQSFTDSLQLNSDFTAARVALAETAAELGNVDKAVKLYFAVIEARPMGVHLDQIRVALARLLLKVDQRENAIIQLNKALAENADNDEARRLLQEIEGGAVQGGAAAGTSTTATTSPSGT
jgi:tetratricopeptide (TPR) repeat protein